MLVDVTKYNHESIQTLQGIPMSLWHITRHTHGYLQILQLHQWVLTNESSFFSALSEGWAPTILNSPEELDFIRQGQLSFTDDRSYWLGGSSTLNHGTTLTSISTEQMIRVILNFKKLLYVLFNWMKSIVFSPNLNLKLD